MLIHSSSVETRTGLIELLSTLARFKRLKAFILYLLAGLRSQHTSSDTSPEGGLSCEISKDICLQIMKRITKACDFAKHA
jgi:hypothetical protein